MIASAVFSPLRAAVCLCTLALFAGSSGCADEEGPTGTFSGTLTRATTAGCAAVATPHTAARVVVTDAGGKLAITFTAGAETCTLDGNTTDDGVASVTVTKSCAIFPASTKGPGGGTYGWLSGPRIELYHALPGTGAGDEPCAAKDTWNLTRM